MVDNLSEHFSYDRNSKNLQVELQPHLDKNLTYFKI
jgi:hypothetical protein